MPGTLKMLPEDEGFALILKGLDDDEFQDSLAKVRSVPGRRWNPKAKRWEFPKDVMTVQRIVQVLKPDLDGPSQDYLQAEAAAMAEEVATKIADDAELPLPGASVMYPYQRAGARFLVDHPHALLADDMGLGKTIQSIAAVLSHASEAGVLLGGERKLVICPNSLKLNWKREIQKWVPLLVGVPVPEEDLDHLVPVVILDGSKAKREKLLKKAPKNAWIIVNWEKLRIIPELAKIKPYAIIADEVHRAKNRKALQTKALWKLQAPVQIALTGTPLMNTPDELWAILKWLFPKEYTSYWRFFEQYVDYYEGYFGRVITGVRNPDHLRFELADKLARRTKGKVLDLPDKTRVVLPVELGPKQRALYDEVEEEFWVEIEQAAQEGDTTAQRILENPTDLLSIPNAAARCTRLRQVASTPALLGADDDSAKLDAAVELIQDGPRDKQWVVFCHFKGTAEVLSERLSKAKISSSVIHGDISTDLRQAAVEIFQSGTTRVFIATIATGGVGLTLTNAQDVIFIERDWVPANNEQAEDRLHRIGQDNAVTVWIIEAQGTVDTMRISPANKRKSAVVSSIIETDAVPERAA